MDHQALILQIWEAVNTERHLQGVLEAASDLLLPVVPFDSLAILHFDGESHDLYALHAPANPLREGETLQQFLRRLDFPPIEVPSRPIRPYDPELGQRWREMDKVYSVEDIFVLEQWFEHEYDMARSGVRAYCSMNLKVRGKVIGGAAYSRRKPIAYTQEELDLLRAISRPLAVAVSNALANAEIARLRAQLQQENIALRAALGERTWFSTIVGDSVALRTVLQQAEEVADTDATVLITGETGTGKELVARAIHGRSQRSSGPLVKVNCGAMPPTLIASELFGHEKGAFTGAVERRKGRFEQAQGGTLFLDEIGELPLDVQSLLLRALQEREFERLGGSSTLQADVRIIAATNRNLAQEMREELFRSDLFYRLNVFPVHMPALRERPEDIPALVGHFVALYSARFNRPITQIEEASLRMLRNYSWPGNVRELENVVERAVILARGGVLRISREMVPQGEMASLPSSYGSERGAIEGALSACRGRISGKDGAARMLGMPASTLEFRIKRLGINKFHFRRAASVH